MSYELVIAREALPDLARLDFWLQEEVIDELEELAEDPPATPGARLYRMIRLRGDDVETLFLRLEVDPSRATITLAGVNASTGTP